MSKFLAFPDVCFKDRELLLEALKQIGYPTVEEGTALSLYGYQGDRRKETAEIVVRRKYVGGSSNDLGFRLTEAGYVPVISEFDLGYTQDGKLLANLRSAYTQAVAARVAARLRGTIQQQVQGNMRVVRVRY